MRLAPIYTYTRIVWPFANLAGVNMWWLLIVSALLCIETLFCTMEAAFVDVDLIETIELCAVW